ncbi:MAG: class F sortase [Humibacillus sp.]|nr:class F sortase [Humibacillus sp.]MDN5777544.1 class F sortase [Humibacillus sp.]
MQQRRTLVLTAVIALMTVAAAWLIILRPLAPDPVSASPGTPSATSSSTTATAGSSAAPTKSGQPSTATVLPRSTAGATAGSSAGRPASTSGKPRQSTAISNRCTAGIPARLVIPALGVNATFQSIGVDTKAPADSQGRRPLGNPSDRTQAGWYSAGPQPGSGTGTVLVNGHTYHDGSAIFKDSFASQIADGQRIDVVQVNGSTCSYQVQRVWRDVAKSDYPTIVSGQDLYNFSGPERLFLATCGGPFNSAEQNYDYINLLIATPIDRG